MLIVSDICANDNEIYLILSGINGWKVKLILTSLKISDCSSLDSFSQAVGFLEIMHHENIGRELKHILLSTAGWKSQE